MFDTASMTDFWLRVIGLYFLVAGTGLFLQLDKVAGLAAEIRGSFLLRFMAGIMALAFGVVILATHANLGGGKAMVVTIIGWISLFKGVFLMLAPPALLGAYEGLVGNKALMRIWALLVAAIGVGFVWLGYAG